MSDKIINTLNNNIRLPVIIWGTKTAAHICYRVLKNLGVHIDAVGDNNLHKWGGKFYDITIMSSEEIKERYVNAFIVVGSFSYEISDVIIAQLKKMNKFFMFCRFEQIEYMYETRCLNRIIYNKEKYYHIINNISSDREYA